MSQSCPICGESVEHVRRERPNDPPAFPGERPGPHATIEVDKLCDADPDDQWDRICHKAAVERGEGVMVPVLDVFYHFWPEDEDVGNETAQESV